MFKKEKLIFLAAFIVIVGYCLSLANFNNTASKELQEVKGTIIEYDVFPDYQRIVIRSGYNKILGYYNGEQEFKLGYKVTLYGRNIPLHTQRVPFGYNEKTQLYAKGIKHKMAIDAISVLSRHWSILEIRTFVTNYMDKTFSNEVSDFLQAMLLGKSYLLEEETKASLSRSGIMHLFAVSGLHIQLFVLMFHNGLKKLRVEEKQTQWILSVFLIIYMVVTNFSSSVVRASSMYFLHLFSKKYNLLFSGVDVISIVFIIWIVVNPYAAFSIGFILSFLSAVVIMLFQMYVSHLKEMKQIFFVSTILLLVGLPVVSQFQGNINVFTPMFNILFIPLVSKIILPFTVIVLILPILAKPFQTTTYLFIELLINLDNTFYFPVSMKRFNGLELFVYYSMGGLFLIFYTAQKVKKAVLFGLCVVIGYVILFPHFTIFGEVTFLDLDNGESTIIREPNNRCNMIIDTGDGKNDVVQKYLQNYNIPHLDYLVLTHQHLDHNGEATKLLESRVINTVVTHYQDQTQYGIHTIRVKEGDQFTCGKISFVVLNPNRDSSNENDNSIVLYAKIGALGFLFLGDVTKAEEARIAAKYSLEVDVVKIAHHGSKTSTSSELLQRFKPSYAIIMTGRVLKFGFPHQEVINLLEEQGITIYRTDTMYSTRYIYIGEKYYRFQTLEKTKQKIL